MECQTRVTTIQYAARGVFVRTARPWRRFRLTCNNVFSDILASGADMNDEFRDLQDYKPLLVGPKPFSLDNILRSVAPAPDEETERFVAAIYADRRQATEAPRPE